MAEFIVELLLVIQADSFTDAEALGERAGKQAGRAVTPRSAGRARILNVILSDVRTVDDDPGPDSDSPRNHAEPRTQDGV